MIQLFHKRHCYGIIFFLGLLIPSSLYSQPLCDTLNPAFQASTLTPCPGTPVNFAALDPTAVSYQWTFSNNIVPDGTGISLTRSFPGQAAGYNVLVTLTLEGVDSMGAACTVSSTQTVSVSAQPQFFLVDTSGTKDFKACVPGNGPSQVTKAFQITNLSGTPPFTWDFGDGTVITSAALVQPHTYLNYGTYLLTVTDNSSPCPRTITQPVSFFGNTLNANMNVVGSINICEGQTIQVNNGTDTVNQIIERFIWSWGNGDQDTVSNALDIFYNYTYDDDEVCDSLLNAQGNFEESIRLTIENGCATHYNESPVFVKPLPRPRIDGPGLGCKNVPVTFTNANSCPDNPAIQYTWIWGDGTTTGPLPFIAGAMAVMHTYTDTGEYTIQLVAELASCNYTDTVDHTIRILEPPVANFVAVPTFGCSPLDVDVVNSSFPTFAAGYLWTVTGGGFSFLDSTDDDDFQPRFQLQDSGFYVIRLDVTNLCGTAFAFDTVQVARPPVITLAPIADTCGFWDYIPVVAYNDNGNPITNYSWNFGNGVPGTSNQAFPTGPIFFGPGNHTVSVTVNNLCGSTTVSQSFVVDTPVTNVLAGANFQLCVNLDTTFAGIPAGGTWTGPSITPGGFFSPSTPGTYQLIYEIGAGNCRVADTMIVDVVDAPVVTILPVVSNSFCVGDPQITLIADTGGVALDTFGIFQPLFPTIPGDSLIIYEFLAQNGCSDRDTIALTVHPLPVVSVTDDTFCQNSNPVTLSPGNPIGGTWTGFNVLNGSSGTFLPDSIDTFPLTYTFTDGNGCESRDTAQVTVVLGDIAVAGPDTTICRNNNILTLSQYSPAGGTWTGGGIITGTDQFDPLAGSIGTNLLVYTSGVGSCLTTDSLIVTIQDTLPVTAGPDLTVCEGDLPFQVTGGTAAGTWLTSTGLTSTAPPIFDPGLIPANGTDTLQIELFSLAGCRSVDETIILVDDKPVAQFSLDTVACTGDVVTPGQMAAGATIFSWTFGDGSISNQQFPTHTYTDTGTFVVTNFIEDPAGCRDSAFQSIRITEAPIPLFTLSSTQGCAPFTVSFLNSSIRNGGTYFWDLGNGQTFSGATPPDQTYLQGIDDTTYIITLSITNDCGTTSISDTITVLPQPQVTIGTQVSSGCSPLLIDFGNTTTGNPTSYFWDLGYNGLTSTDSIPLSIYYTTDTLPSTYTITLIATNQCGSDTGDAQIIVLPNDLNPIFNTDTTAGCAPLTVNFSNLSGSQFVAWDYGVGLGNQDVGNDQPSFVFQNPGTYLVQMFADNGCSKDTGEITITVFPAAPATFPAPQPVCLGDTIQFTAAGSASINGYLWDFGDGSSSTQASPGYQFQSPGTYTVTLTTFSTTYQCPASTQASVLIRPLPDPSFDQQPVAGCIPFTINPVAPTTNLTYLWDFGNGDQAVGNSPTYTYQQDGTFDLSLIVTDGFGCENDSGIQVTAHPLPQSSFNLDLDTLCGPGLVAFTNTSSNPTGPFWTFGTGVPSDTANTVDAQFIFPAPGTYVVSLESETPFGCKDTALDTVHVYPQPVADISPDVTEGCIPLAVTFQNLSTGASKATWTWGDGTPGSAQFQPGTHTFFAPDDSFTVRMIADTAGYCLDTAFVTIRTASWPVAAFLQDQTEACETAVVTFTNTSTSAVLPLTYQWDFGNTTVSTLETPQPVSYTQPASYQIRLIATNSYQCQDTALGEFILYPQPEARFIPSDSTICAPDDITFTNQSTNFSQANWDFGNGFTSTGMSPTHNFIREDATILITLIVDTAGVCFDTTSLRIRTSSYPEADFSPSIDKFCGETPVTFTNLSTTALHPISYAWDFGNGRVSTLETPESSYAVGDLPITFFPELIVTNTFGCADTVSKPIEGLPQPSAAFVPVFDGDCSPLEVNFLNLSSGFNGSQWRFSNGISSDSTSPVVLFDVGEWDVNLVVDWDEFCYDSLIARREIIVRQSAIADFAWDLSPTATADGTVAFTNNSLFADEYIWTFGDGNNSTEVNPVHRYFSGGPFEVSLIANNSINCPDTAFAFDFSPREFGGLYVPNAMAPNSGVDSANVFLPVAVNLCYYELFVYDAWGKLVWYTDELTDDRRPAVAWDGSVTRDSRLGGDPANLNVFSWVVRYNFNEECDRPNVEPRIQTGSLTIVR